MPKPAKSDRLLASAYSAHQAGNLADARLKYRRLLRIDPRHCDALNLLGLLHIQTRQFDDASRVLRKAIALTPDNANTQYNAGAAAIGRGQPAEAAEFFRAALRLDPENEATRSALASALNNAGVKALGRRDYDAAIDWYRQAAEADEADATALLNLGMLLEQRGYASDAEQCFLRAIEVKPDSVEAHFQLAFLKQHASTRHEIGMMNELLPDQGKEKQALLAFAIAKALEKLGEYDEEFGWLQRAHTSMASLQPYDHESTVAHLSKLRGIADSITAGATDVPQLVFVVGMPRSGTTLCEQIISSHPRAFGCGEQMLGAKAFNQLSNTSTASDVVASALAESLIDMSCGESLLIDTTPGNFQYLGLLKELFPTARFIHCRRAPLDTCMSILQYPLSDEHAYAHSLESLGRYWNLYDEMMRYWKDMLDDRLFDLQYETLASEFEGTVRRLLGFCDLSFDERCLKFFETERTIKTPSASQVRQPIYSSSIGRWKRYESHLMPLIDTLGI